MKKNSNVAWERINWKVIIFCSSFIVMVNTGRRDDKKIYQREH